MQAKKILLIQLRQLGDILLTTPCIREIRRECPDAHITFLTHKMGRLILANNPLLDDTITYHESDSLLGSLKILGKLRKSGYDLVIDFMNNPRSALFSVLTGAKKRVSFHSSRSLAYTSLIPRPKGGEYIVLEKFQLLKACGFNPDQIHLMFPWFASDLKPFFSFAETYKGYPPSALRVVMSPTHRRMNRKWPAHSYAELADILSLQFGAVVTWIWGPGEEEEIDQVVGMCKSKTFKAPPTSLQELAAFCAQQDLFIGNSNGPSHIAVAVDICTLQLHGHTELEAWCPMTPRHRGIQSPEFYGSGPVTLNSITPDMVLDVLRAMEPEILRQKESRLQRSGPAENWKESQTGI